MSDADEQLLIESSDTERRQEKYDVIDDIEYNNHSRQKVFEKKIPIGLDLIHTELEESSNLDSGFWEQENEVRKLPLKVFGTVGSAFGDFELDKVEKSTNNDRRSEVLISTNYNCDNFNTLV